MSTSFRASAGLVLAAAIVLGATAAHAQDVSFNAMPNTNWAKFKTYKWVKIEGAQYPDQIMDNQIKAAIDAQLASKGLTKSENDPADLYVGYQVAVEKEKEWTAYGMGGGPGWGYGAGYGYGGGGGMTTATSSTIHIGTLGLDIYDPAAKQLLWRGAASKTLDPKAKPEKRQKNVVKAVTKMLKNYPPAPKT